MDLNKARRLAIEGTRERARDRLTELCMLDDDETSLTPSIAKAISAWNSTCARDTHPPPAT